MGFLESWCWIVLRKIAQPFLFYSGRTILTIFLLVIYLRFCVQVVPIARTVSVTLLFGYRKHINYVEHQISIFGTVAIEHRYEMTVRTSPRDDM
jgi:hypothetical protein